MKILGSKVGMTAILACALAAPALGQELGQEPGQEPENLAPVPEPPEIPPQLQSGETIEPEITIIRKKDTTHEEYRVNGHLYMVKVIPTVGPSYYMLDEDGDGALDSRLNSLDSNFTIPQWVLFSW